MPTVSWRRTCRACESSSGRKASAVQGSLQERGTGVKTVEQILPSGEEIADLPAPPVLGPDHIRLREGGYPSLSFEMDALWPIEPDG